MPIHYQEDIARFEGICTVEEAERLQQWLDATPAGGIDVTACEHLHTAILQVLLYQHPRIVGEPEEPFLTIVLDELPRTEAEVAP